MDLVENHLGGGLSGKLGDQAFYIGHKAFIEDRVSMPAPDYAHQKGMEIWLASSQEWLACYRLDDQPRDDAALAITTLQNMGIQTILLSGDRSDHVAEVAKTLGISEAIGQASPEQKLEVLEKLRNEGHQIMMVGDGLNDLPSMAGAGVSVAMGRAADLTQLKADAVLLNGQLVQLVAALKASRQTRRIIRQNLGWALAYNLCALPLAAAGMVPPWLAAIGMSASSLLVVLNALRLGKDTGQPRRKNIPPVGAQAVS
jgi:Cu2+-exporting ATPase